MIGGRVRHHEFHDRNRQQCEHPGDREDAGHADHTVEHRAQHHRHRESDADGDADHRHRLGAEFLAREVRSQRHHRRVSGALRPGPRARDDDPDVGRDGGDEAAGREQQQSDVDDPLATVAVRHPAEGYLEDRLGRP